MSNVFCARCGEPWDCTGGLHFTHTDMTEPDFNDLLQGRGCMCCRENLGDENNAMQWADGFVAMWRSSVEHLGEGQPKWMYATLGVEPDKSKTFADLYDPRRP